MQAIICCNNLEFPSCRVKLNISRKCGVVIHSHGKSLSFTTELVVHQTPCRNGPFLHTRANVVRNRCWNHRVGSHYPVSSLFGANKRDYNAEIKGLRNGICSSQKVICIVGYTQRNCIWSATFSSQSSCLCEVQHSISVA